MFRCIAASLLALSLAQGAPAEANTKGKAKQLSKVDCAKLRSVNRWEAARTKLSRSWALADKHRGAIAHARSAKVAEASFRAFARSAQAMVAPLRVLAAELGREPKLYKSLRVTLEAKALLASARAIVADARKSTKRYRSLKPLLRTHMMNRRALALLTPVKGFLAELSGSSKVIDQAAWVRTCRGKLAARKAGAKGKATRVVSFVADPVDDSTLTPTQIRKVLRMRGLMIRMCADGAGKRVRGKIKVSFRVKPDGTVAKQRIRSSTIKSRAVKACVLRAVAKLRFPRSGRGAKVTYPFAF